MAGQATGGPKMLSQVLGQGLAHSLNTRSPKQHLVPQSGGGRGGRGGEEVGKGGGEGWIHTIISVQKTWASIMHHNLARAPRPRQINIMLQPLPQRRFESTVEATPAGQYSK